MTVEDNRYEEYQGGCHCGHVTFSMKLSAPLYEYDIINCNCSICRRMDPPYEDVTWHDGSKERCNVYQFNTKSMNHLFCPKCGASICIDFINRIPRGYGISARSINGVDMDRLKRQKVDGFNEATPAGDLSGQEQKGTT